MPKDNENVPLPNWSTDGLEESVPAPFAPDQMVRCDECLRANPPTRVNCLYCGAVLPHDENTVALQKPALRPLEKWEQGYNNILLPPVANLNAAQVAEAADLLRLRPEDLDRILAFGAHLPIARAATSDEAELIQRRLAQLGIDSRIMPDAESGSDPSGIVKVRALDVDEAGIYAYETPDKPFIQISWSDLILLIAGRLIVKRVELQEKKAKLAEHKIVDSSEFMTDELVVDFYTRNDVLPYRIAANSFDFSCLGSSKGLFAGENISRLVTLFREHAPHVEYDDSFKSARKILELVWPSEQQNESSGWRRERPGKVSIGSVIEINNEMQFSRYSHLRRYLQNAEETSGQAGESR